MRPTVQSVADDNLARVASVVSALQDRNLPCHKRADIIFGLWDDRNVNQVELETSMLATMRDLLRTNVESDVIDAEVLMSMEVSGSSTPSDSEKSESSSLVRSVGGDSVVIGGQMSSFRSESSLAQSPVAWRKSNSLSAGTGKNETSNTTQFYEGVVPPSYSFTTAFSPANCGATNQGSLPPKPRPINAAAHTERAASRDAIFALEICVLNRLLSSSSISLTVKEALAKLLVDSPHMHNSPIEVCNLLINWLADSKFLEMLRRLNEQIRANTHKPTHKPAYKTNNYWPAEWEERLKYSALSSTGVFPQLTGKLDRFAFPIVQSTLIPITLQIVLCLCRKFSEQLCLLSTRASLTSSTAEVDNMGHESLELPLGSVHGFANESNKKELGKAIRGYISSKHYPILVLCALSVQASELFIYRLHSSQVFALVEKSSELGTLCLRLLLQTPTDSKSKEITNYVSCIAQKVCAIGTNPLYTRYFGSSIPLLEFMCLCSGAFEELNRKTAALPAEHRRFWYSVCSFNDGAAAHTLLRSLALFASDEDSQSQRVAGFLTAARYKRVGALQILSELFPTAKLESDTLDCLLAILSKPIVAALESTKSLKLIVDSECLSKEFSVLCQFVDTFSGNLALSTWCHVFSIVRLAFRPTVNLLKVSKAPFVLLEDTSIDWRLTVERKAADDANCSKGISVSYILHLLNYLLNTVMAIFQRRSMFLPYKEFMLEMFLLVPEQLPGGWLTELIKVSQELSQCAVGVQDFATALKHWPQVISSVRAHYSQSPNTDSSKLALLFQSVSQSLTLCIQHSLYYGKFKCCIADIKCITAELAQLDLSDSKLSEPFTRLLQQLAENATTELLNPLLTLADSSLDAFVPIDANQVLECYESSLSLINSEDDFEDDDTSTSASETRGAMPKIVLSSPVKNMNSASEKDILDSNREVGPSTSKFDKSSDLLNFLFALMEKFAGSVADEKEVFSRILLFFHPLKTGSGTDEQLLNTLLSKLFVVTEKRVSQVFDKLLMEEDLKCNALLYWMSRSLSAFLDFATKGSGSSPPSGQGISPFTTFPTSFFKLLKILPWAVTRFSCAMPSLKYLKVVLCTALSSKALPAAFSTMYRGVDVTSHLCNLLAHLPSLRHPTSGAIFGKWHADEIVHTLVFSLCGRSVCVSKTSLQALFLVAFESELSLMKYLQAVLLKLGMLSRAELAVPILELLLGITFATINSFSLSSSSSENMGLLAKGPRAPLSPTSNSLGASMGSHAGASHQHANFSASATSPDKAPYGTDKRESILKNLVEQEWKRVFGIAVQYIKSPPMLYPGTQMITESHRASTGYIIQNNVDDATLLKCQCVSNYTLQLAYQTIVCYFNKLKGSERQRYVSFIVNQLTKSSPQTSAPSSEHQDPLASAFEVKNVSDLSEFDDNVLLVFDILGLLWWDTLIGKQRGSRASDFDFTLIKVYDKSAVELAEKHYLESQPLGTNIFWETRCLIAGYQVITLKIALFGEISTVSPDSWLSLVRRNSLCIITCRRPCGIRRTAVFWSVLLSQQVPFVPIALVKYLYGMWKSSGAGDVEDVGLHSRSPTFSGLLRTRSRSELSSSSKHSRGSHSFSMLSSSSSTTSSVSSTASSDVTSLVRQSSLDRMSRTSSPSRLKQSASEPKLPAILNSSDPQEKPLVASLEVIGDKVNLLKKSNGRKATTNPTNTSSSRSGLHSHHRSSKSIGGSVSELTGMRPTASVSNSSIANEGEVFSEGEMDWLLNGKVVKKLFQIPHLNTATAAKLDGRTKQFYEIEGLVDVDGSAARALSVLDRTPVVDLHKIGIVYVGPGQVKELEILGNRCGSPTYHQFLDKIGKNFCLRSAQSGTYTGGLDTSDEAIDGERALAWEDRLSQVIFHVATEMPSRLSVDPQMLSKKRHIGNNYVLLVWDDSLSDRDYDFHTIPGQFNFVNVVIKPITRKDRPPCARAAKTFSGLRGSNFEDGFSDTSFSVSLQCREGMPADTHALALPKIVSGHGLAGFVRSIAIQMNMLVQIWQATLSGSEITRHALCGDTVANLPSSANESTFESVAGSDVTDMVKGFVNGKALYATSKKRSTTSGKPAESLAPEGSVASPVKVSISNTQYLSNWRERLLQIKRMTSRFNRCINL